MPIPDCYKLLITRCWSQKAENRPTFSEVVEEFKTNEDFITVTVDKDENLYYIDLLDSLGSSFDPSKKFKRITIPSSQNDIREELNKNDAFKKLIKENQDLLIQFHRQLKR